MELGRERAFRIQRLERLFLRLKAVEAVLTAYVDREASLRRLQRLFLACQDFGDSQHQQATLSQQVCEGTVGAEMGQKS